MKVEVEIAKCVGLGMCEAAAPDVFEVGADGLVAVHHDQVEQAHVHEIEAAISSCPMAALRFTK